MKAWAILALASLAGVAACRSTTAQLDPTPFTCGDGVTCPTGDVCIALKATGGDVDGGAPGAGGSAASGTSAPFSCSPPPSACETPMPSCACLTMNAVDQLPCDVCTTDAMGNPTCTVF